MVAFFGKALRLSLICSLLFLAFFAIVTVAVLLGFLNDGTAHSHSGFWRYMLDLFLILVLAGLFGSIVGFGLATLDALFRKLFRYL